MINAPRRMSEADRHAVVVALDTQRRRRRLVVLVALGLLAVAAVAYTNPRRR